MRTGRPVTATVYPVVRLPPRSTTMPCIRPNTCVGCMLPVLITTRQVSAGFRSTGPPVALISTSTNGCATGCTPGVDLLANV